MKLKPSLLFFIIFISIQMDIQPEHRSHSKKSFAEHSVKKYCCFFKSQAYISIEVKPVPNGSIRTLWGRTASTGTKGKGKQAEVPSNLVNPLGTNLSANDYSYALAA